MISSDWCCRVVGLKHIAGLEPRDQLSRHGGQSREVVCKNLKQKRMAHSCKFFWDGDISSQDKAGDQPSKDGLQCRVLSAESHDCRRGATHWFGAVSRLRSKTDIITISLFPSSAVSQSFPLSH